MPNTVAQRAADFTDATGVCVHLEQTNTPYGNESLVEQEMLYLGVHNARVQAPGSNLAIYQGLAEIGVKFDLLFETTNLAGELAAAEQIAPYVESIEGPNELDGYPISYDGLTGVAAADAYQQAMFAAIKADPLLNQVRILPFSLAQNFPASGSPLSTYGSQSAYATDGNIHAYGSYGVPPYWWVSGVLKTTDTPGLPQIITETGSYTLPDGGSGVDQYVQAAWTLDTLLDAYKNGVAQTYIYQLMDPEGDPANDNPESHFGLFNTDGTPKLAATALHDLNAILADNGTAANTFAAGSLNYGVSGLPTYWGFNQLFEKSDGQFDIALWQEPQLWNAQARTQNVITPSSVTVSFGAVMYQVQVFDPFAGSAAVATYSNVSSISLSLGTDALIVQVTPTGTETATAVAGAPVIDGLTTGTDTGQSATDGVTANATPTLYGTAMAGSLVTLFDGSTVLGTAVADSTGDWAFGVTTPLATGVHSITATATTAAGTSPVAAPSLVTIENVAPTVTGIASATAGGTTVNPGGTVAFTLALSSAVLLNKQGGTPTLALNDGGVATYDAAASTALSLVFTTTTLGGQAAADLTVQSLALNGATATDLAGNPLAPGDLTGVAGASTGVVVDPTALPVTLGSGAQSIVVDLSEADWQGDAQATFSVDGVQVGGVQTVTAIHGVASQAFTLLGNFARGSHSVAVSFVNNDWGGTLTHDRQLDVDSITAGGVTQAEGQSLLFNGTLTFNSPAVFTAAPAPVTLGTGPDSITVEIAENAWQGDAQFTLSVDGVQVGGTQTASAEQSAGQTQAFTLDGTFGPGEHVVGVALLNPAYGGSGLLQRILYVNGISAGGTTTSTNAVLTTTLPTASLVALPAAPVATVTLGSGPDSINVGMSEDAYMGSAQFTLSVDGVQVGGTQTTTALHSAGQVQTFTLDGSFGAGSHVVSVDYLNFATGGASPAVRNLYVDTIRSNGGSSTPAALIDADGISSYTANLIGTSLAAVSLGSGSSSIIVDLSEDAYQGSAKFALFVDGQQIGGQQTASASHKLGQSQAFTLDGNFSAGQHFVTVAFQNQVAGRNLYIDSVTAGGATKAVSSQMTACFASVTANTAQITPHTLTTSTWATAAFIGAAGAAPLDGGTGTTPLTLSSQVGATAFILHAGAANGDIIQGFRGAKMASSDFLELKGYGTGATLTQVNHTTWAAASASGTIRDLIHIANGAVLVPANTLFVNS